MSKAEQQADMDAASGADEIERERRSMRVMESEDIGLTPCMEGDHEWRFQWPEWDVGFCGFKECEFCGTTAALEPGDCEFEEYE